MSPDHQYTSAFSVPFLTAQTNGWLGVGIDSALLWPTYTNIGVDDRNQFQLIESQPGGVDGLRQARNPHPVLTKSSPNPPLILTQSSPNRHPVLT